MQLPYAELLGPDPDERFAKLTSLAQQIFDTPIALLTLRDSDRTWFKSRYTRNTGRTPIEARFCADLDPSVALVIPDTRRDERFRDHPLVVNLPEIRFYAGCPVRVPDGTALGTLCVIDHEPRDVGANEIHVLRDLAWMIEQELRSLSLATLDELTGLTNRRGFDAIAAHAIAVCRRSGQPATLLYFDLDDFKEINDRQGHSAGDRALRTFADRLRSTFRDSDVVARIGGDEFCVLLTSATALDVERPLAILAAQLRDSRGVPIVKFSVGVETFDADKHESVQSVLDAADRRMYEEKFGRKDGFRTPRA